MNGMEAIRTVERMMLKHGFDQLANMTIKQLKEMLVTLRKEKTQEARDAIQIVKNLIRIKKGRLNLF